MDRRDPHLVRNGIVGLVVIALCSFPLLLVIYTKTRHHSHMSSYSVTEPNEHAQKAPVS